MIYCFWENFFGIHNIIFFWYTQHKKSPWFDPTKFRNQKSMWKKQEEYLFSVAAAQSLLSRKMLLYRKILKILWIQRYWEYHFWTQLCPKWLICPKKQFSLKITNTMFLIYSWYLSYFQIIIKMLEQNQLQEQILCCKIQKNHESWS